MAVCGILLGTVAPTTAYAATSADGTKTSLSHNGMAEATPDNPATAQSDASVTVVSGFLTLEQVPDFSFGRVMENTTARLQQGTSAIDDDGNQDGILRVTESRKDNAGFDVTAKMDDFTNDKDVVSKGFVLNLNPVAFINASNGDYSGIQTGKVSLDADKEKTVLSATKENKLQGTYQAKYSDSKDASLVVPKDTSSKDSGKTATSYKGKITWTLNAKAEGTTTGDNNNGGGQTPPAEQ